MKRSLIVILSVAVLLIVADVVCRETGNVDSPGRYKMGSSEWVNRAIVWYLKHCRNNEFHIDNREYVLLMTSMEYHEFRSALPNLKRLRQEWPPVIDRLARAIVLGEGDINGNLDFARGAIRNIKSALPGSHP